MGDGADQALEDILAEEELRTDWKLGLLPLEDALAAGVVDYDGTELSPNSICVPPLCPKCSAKMILRTGKYGKFWGCSMWPRCSGSRTYRRQLC
ncbi:MAG: hypothetical protein DRN26_05705 [Thermoplasmata archaeon]|nr:MAG: hypothetical protein DRN26_05705 [Thermoplasmata archaeon]